MDCNLARQLMVFRRTSGPSELSRDDVTALNAHVATCPTCTLQLEQQATFDASITKAMKSVLVPAGAKNRVLMATITKQTTQFRRKLLTTASLAACLLLAVGFATGFFHNLRPAFDTHQLAWTNERILETPERSVQEWLASQDLPTTAPIEFDYFNYLEHSKQTEQGRDVPVVTFVVRQPNSPRYDFAKMYVITDGQFNFKKLKDDQTSLCTVSVFRDPRRPGIAWVVLHTTQTIDPFRKPIPVPGA